MKLSYDLTTHTLSVSARVDLEAPKEGVLSSKSAFDATIATLKTSLEGVTFWDVQYKEFVRVGLVKANSTDYAGFTYIYYSPVRIKSILTHTHTHIYSS